MRACFVLGRSDGPRAIRSEHSLSATRRYNTELQEHTALKTTSSSMLLLRRTCSSRRVPTSLTSGMSGRKHVHSHFRQLHTATGRNTGNTSSSNVFALALGSVALGLGGYYVGVRRAIETPPPKPVYGTPKDFAHAIEELKALFSKEAVTTDEGQLAAHGFSPNAYHPGTPCHSDTNTWLLTFGPSLDRMPA
jgi:hypothetical protein